MGVVTFEVEIEWVRETSTTWQTTYADGTRGPEGSTHSDFYGLATSPTEIVDAARNQVGRLGLVDGSATRVDVLTTVSDTPLIRDPRSTDRYGARSYVRIPRDWVRAGDPGLAGLEAREARRRAAPLDTDWMWDPAIERPTTRGVSEASSGPLVIWTSANGDGSLEAQAAFDTVVAAVKRDLPADEAARVGERLEGWYARGMRKEAVVVA